MTAVAGIGRRPWLSLILGKLLVALTASFLSLFLLVHMIGTSLIFVGPQAFNTYGHIVSGNTIILAIEVGLLGAILGHAALAVWLAVYNHGRRGRAYARSPVAAKRTSLAARTMVLQGVLILAFLVYHLATQRLGAFYTVNYDGVVMRDQYRLVCENFSNPWIVLFYVTAVLSLGFHLGHGGAAMFQSFGFCRSTQSLVVHLSRGFAALAAVVFAAEPLFVYLLVLRG